MMEKLRLLKEDIRKLKAIRAARIIKIGFEPVSEKEGIKIRNDIEIRADMDIAEMLVHFFGALSPNKLIDIIIDDKKKEYKSLLLQANIEIDEYAKELDKLKEGNNV